MKYGWRLLFIPLWAFCVAGAALVAFFVYGWYAWEAFALAAAIGALIGVPAGIWNTKKVRREDGSWDTTKE